MTESTGSTSRRTVLRAGAATAAAGTAAGTASAEQHNEWAADIEDYLADVGNFDGIEDRRDEDEVEITVGAGDNGLKFDPAAVQIAPGTTVRWQWTGAGGQHNVVHDAEEIDDVDEAAFESELVGDEGHTFEQTFEDPGRFRYVCTVHRSSEMKGGILVSDEDVETGPSISPGWAAAASVVFLIPVFAAVYLMFRKATGSEE